MADQEHAAGNLFTFPEVVKTIFLHLPAKSLSNVSSVCKLWQSQAAFVLRQRRQYAWNLFTDDPNTLCTDKLTLWDWIPDYFQNLSFKPTTILVFSTKKSLANVIKCKGKKRSDVSDFSDFVKHLIGNSLPSGCHVICHITSGVIGTSSDMSRTIEEEKEGCAAVFCFGHHPDMDIVVRKVSPQSWGTFPDIFQDLNSLSELEDVQAVLMMTDIHNLMGADSTECMMERKYVRPLVMGGLTMQSFVFPAVKGIAYCQDSEAGYRDKDLPSEDNTVGMFPMFFHGDSVRVACVILAEEKTEKEAEDCILRLKDMTKDFSLHHSVAFIVACGARGKHHYRKPNVESTVFRKHFPTTPLLGMFGGGEIGCEYPPSPDETRVMVHGYTSFIALLSLP